MAHKKASVIFLIVLISFTCAQLDKKTTSTEKPTDPTTPETTSAAPVTDTTTTTTTTPSTTTIPATTTTIAPITTTSSPTPSPVTPPEFKKWWFSDGNQTCVIVQLAVQLNLTYTTNNDDKPANVLYNVPVNATSVATGSCGKDDQSITVQWGQLSQMMLQFTANNSAQQFTLSEIYLSINVSDIFMDAKANQIMQLYHINNDFPTSLAMSYHCNKIQTIGFTNTKDSKDITVNATISHVQLEAFHKQNTDQFSTARDCEAIDTPDIVPIAVGCALAGLVVVVLIAYLIGRRRAQARGYLSM